MKKTISPIPGGKGKIIGVRTGERYEHFPVAPPAPAGTGTQETGAQEQQDTEQATRAPGTIGRGKRPNKWDFEKKKDKEVKDGSNQPKK